VLLAAPCHLDAEQVAALLAGSTVRLAVLAALNIADEYHLLKRRLQAPSPEVHQRATKLASALDEVLRENRLTG